MADVDLRKLRYFVAVAQLENFTRAAQKCFVAQPSLSQQIQKLEREFGGPLFDRTGRKVRLTDRGRALFDRAIEILESRCDITVVFTDIQMPGSMDGLKLARAVRERGPPIKIVATSGHINVGERDLPEGGRFLLKPYSPVQVTGVLRELTGVS